MRRTKGAARNSGSWGSRPSSATAVLAALLLLPISPLGAYGDELDAREAGADRSLREGQQLFAEKGCAECHAVRGSASEQRLGPDLARNESPPTIMRFAGSLWNHVPAMIAAMAERGIEPARISPEDVEILSAYLFYVRFIVDSGNATRGGEVFDERSCSRCHQFQGGGGTTAPRLDDLGHHMSSLFLAQALWNHGPQMEHQMQRLGIVRPHLDGRDVADIVAFLRGSAPGTTVQLAHAQAGSPRAGKILFKEKHCQHCHALQEGKRKTGPNLGTLQPTSRVSNVAAALWNHGVPMWAKINELGMPFPVLTNEEMADLLAYLYFVQYTDQDGDPKQGAEIYRDKSCSLCHTLEGDGAGEGPEVSLPDAARSSAGWISAMWNHAPAMQQRLREQQIAWPRFEGDEMRDLVTVLRSQGGDVTP
jgi:mono/diheme cytochrome c family protein